MSPRCESTGCEQEREASGVMTRGLRATGGVGGGESSSETKPETDSGGNDDTEADAREHGTCGA